jgi:hypothetical protein
MISGTGMARSDLLPMATILQNSRRTSCMAKESTHLPMEVGMKDISKMICDRGMGP